MKKGTAAIVAILTVILSCAGGMIVGAIVGNLIVPARLDWSAQSGPGLLLLGASVGLIGGFIFGIRAAMRIVDDAAAERRAASTGNGLPPPPASSGYDTPPPPAPDRS